MAPMTSKDDLLPAACPRCGSTDGPQDLLWVRYKKIPNAIAGCANCGYVIYKSSANVASEG